VWQLRSDLGGCYAAAELPLGCAHIRPEHLILEAHVATVLAHLELQGMCFDARVRPAAEKGDLRGDERGG
jgi:hypothetical protein